MEKFGSENKNQTYYTLHSYIVSWQANQKHNQS